jgi:hypothetical protein
LFCQSLQQLLATNQQAKARSQQASILMAEAMRQTSLTQCFNPPVAAVAASPVAPPSGYRFFEGAEGQQYLLNDTTNHLVVMPAGPPPPAAARVVAPAPSKMAQSMSPIVLGRDSFEDSLVTPSVTKRPAAAVNTTTLQVVLSEKNRSNKEIFYVAHRRKKKRKTRKTQSLVLPASQSSEVQVIE